MTEAKTSLKRTLVGKVVSDKPAEATDGDAAKTAVKRVRKAAPAAAADGKTE